VSPGTTVIPPNSYSSLGFFWSGGTDSLVIPTNKAAGDQIVIRLFSSLSAVSMMDGIRLSTLDHGWELLDLPHGKTMVSLMDIQGRTLQQSEINAASVMVMNDGLPAGVYLIKLKTERGEKVWKVLR
jgi:hypothetical protein